MTAERKGRTGLFKEAVWLANVQRPAVLEVVRDSRRPKRVAPDRGLDACVLRPPTNHVPGIRGEQRVPGEHSRPSSGRAKERPLLVVGDTRRLDVGIKVLFEAVVGRHLVKLPPLLVQANPP